MTCLPAPLQPQKLLPPSLGHALLQAAHPDPKAARGAHPPLPHSAAPAPSGGALAESPKGLWRWPSILLSLQGPPNFLRASALAEHIKPVVVIPEEAPEDEEPENLIEISSGPPAGEPVVSAPVSPCPTESPREEGSPTHAGQSLGFAPPRGLPHHGGRRSVGQRSVFSAVAGGG